MSDTMDTGSISYMHGNAKTDTLLPGIWIPSVISWSWGQIRNVTNVQAIVSEYGGRGGRGG